MYESFYGFREKPFQIVPNPNFLYLSPKHENALTYLEYGLMERVGFVLLSGEVGSGKTTLIRHILGKIESQIEVAVIFNTNVSPEQLLQMILDEFEIEHGSNDKAQAFAALYKYLIDLYARRKRALLIIDEAQNLSRESLEEIRMLSNLQSDDQILLQIMIVGQPEIRERLRSPDLAQLNQRISVTYHLPALTREETGDYIAYRLEKVDGNPDLFTPEALDLIYRASRGIPRTINILCDSALVYGFADELHNIDALVIEQMLQDRGGMGLESDGCGAESSRMPMSDEKSSEIMSRLKTLEDQLGKIRMQVEWQIEAMERNADSFRDELVRKLKELYTIERNRNDKLVSELARLREKYAALQENADGKGKEDLYSDDHGRKIKSIDEPLSHVK
jgi:putative secretion ATPase (PEP-CTERM system associated)